MPARELERFEQNFAVAENILGTANTLFSMVTNAVDLSDLYRAALVQAVSALDFYVHDEVKAAMVGLFQAPVDSWPPAYGRFRVSLESVREAVDDGRLVGDHAQGDWITNEIQHQHSFLAFQAPEKIADAIRLICPDPLWDAVANHLGVQAVKPQNAAQVVKTQLQLIVDRRNLIVHEADLDPTPPRDVRYPIDDQMATTALEFIRNVVAAIDAVLAPHRAST